MIHKIFENKVALYPNKIAIIDDQGNALTYSELNKLANKFAHYLLNSVDACADNFLMVRVSKKTLSLIVVVLGILKAGAAYIIISPEYPKTIINRICIETRPRLFITDIPNDYLNSFDILQIDEKTKTFCDENIALSHPNKIAYIGYTSGTTSEPKGVIISHENLVVTYQSWEKIYHLKNTDRHLQMANTAFDVFTGDWVRALCSGACLVLCQKESLLQPELLYALIESNKITIAEFVPSVLRELIKYIESSNKKLNTFRLLICGSDIWYLKEYKKLWKFCGGDTRIINSYGLVEATIDSTYYEWSPEDVDLDDASIVPIGVPFPHAQLKIIKDNGEDARVGEKGEIYIGGGGVSQYGYLNDPIKTKERFIADDSGRFMLYKTGDIAKVLDNKRALFIGRNASQFNINGRRVNYHLVESVLLNNQKICSAVVAPVISDDESYLEAFLVLKSDICWSDLTAYLKDCLPIYCIPRYFYEISSLTFNDNGKVVRDRCQQKIIGKISSETLLPQTHTQSVILEIWKSNLNIKSINVDDEFDLISGNSLKYASIIADINKVFKINLCLESKMSTIIEISNRVDSLIKEEIDN